MPRKNDEINHLRELAMDRDRARKTLKQDTAEARKRLKPSNLMAEVRNKASAQVRKAGASAINGIRANPGLTATVAATATLIAMRKPIAKLIASRRISDPDPIEE